MLHTCVAKGGVRLWGRLVKMLIPQKRIYFHVYLCIIYEGIINSGSKFTISRNCGL